jgi:hypothetical protein
MAGWIQNMLLRGLILMAALAGTASPAIADAVPGASYRGVASDFAIVTFTVAADGSAVSSYSITNVHGSTCNFEGNGVAGSWAGTSIVNDAFDYTIGSSMTFQGSFTGAQSASGTFQFQNAAVPGEAAACSTGTVNWTATTAATPPTGGGSGSSGGGSGSSGGGSGSSGGGTGSSGGGSGSSGGGSGSSGGGSGSRGGGSATSGGASAKTKIPTRIVFGKLPRNQLGGRIRSAGKQCLARRTLILLKGSKRIAVTRSKVNGTYAFRSAATLKGQKLHVQVMALTTASAICEAASSANVKA